MELVTDIKNTTSYDELLAGPEIPVLTKNIKIKSGAIYKRGMLISVTIGEDGITETGEQTASGKTAEYVLMRDVDATEAANTVGTVYVKGRFNREKIVLANGDTV